VSPGSGKKLENIYWFRLAKKEYLKVQVRNLRTNSGSG